MMIDDLDTTNKCEVCLAHLKRTYKRGALVIEQADIDALPDGNLVVVVNRHAPTPRTKQVCFFHSLNYDE